MNGMRDYLTLLNEREGGVNGVTLISEECETAFATEKGLECYDKTKVAGLLSQPWSAALFSELLPRAATDKVPLFAPGHGFSALADGATFPWAFNPPLTMADGASMILDHIARGMLPTLEGKTIALLYLDVPHGAVVLPFLQAQAEQHKFTILPLPVSVKEMQSQTAQWRQIASAAPDFVLLWGWGQMNQTAMQEAVKARYPMNQIIGIWSASHDSDLAIVGEAGKGYRALSWNMPDSRSALMRAIRVHVIDMGKSMADRDSSEFDGVFYQRGVLVSMIAVEAFRGAQMHFDSQSVTAEQMRWGFENLNLTEARLKELGVEGMIGAFKTSCQDHSGHGGAWMLEWDGAKFVQATLMLRPDRVLVAPFEAEQAKAFAAANKDWPTQSCK